MLKPHARADTDPASLGGTARSLTDAVYNSLRRDILTNALRQNEKLYLGRLQERFDVSLSVVREALSRLSSEGLVVAESQRGFRVSPISREDLIDVTQTRIRIEGMALELAIQKGSDAWAARVQAQIDTLLALNRQRYRDRWVECHDSFHQLLIEPCDSPWLLRFRQVLFEQSERYRYVFGQLNLNQQLVSDRDVDEEHRRLAQAVLSRRPKEAVQALQQHFTATMEHVLKHGDRLAAGS